MEVPSPDQLPRLSDGLVTLRRPVLDDVPAITEACQDPETQRWTTIPVPYGEADARWFVQDYPTRGAPHQGRLAVFAITSGDDRFCGAIDLRVGDDGMGTVGYSVAPWARGRGVGDMRADKPGSGSKIGLHRCSISDVRRFTGPPAAECFHPAIP